MTASSNTQQPAPDAPESDSNPITSDYFEREAAFRKRHRLSDDAIIFPTDLYSREELVKAAQHEIRRCIEGQRIVLLSLDPCLIGVMGEGGGNRFRFRCEQLADGVPVNPFLQPDFDNTPNAARTARDRAWWGLPFIRTQRDTHPVFLKAWPEGIRYDVRCLDGGAWDRSTNRGQFATIAEAVAFAKTITEWEVAA